MRNRITIVKEDRIWQLRCHGYSYESIGRIVNCNPYYMTTVLRRVRRRPPYEQDPIRRGRGKNFLSDAQIQDIRIRRTHGETGLSIAKDYNVSETTIYLIANYKTYKEPANDSGYEYSFTNRLTKQ